MYLLKTLNLKIIMFSIVIKEFNYHKIHLHH